MGYSAKYGNLCHARILLHRNIGVPVQASNLQSDDYCFNLLFEKVFLLLPYLAEYPTLFLCFVCCA